MNRYLPHLKPLESEGFHVSAVSESGIVLSRDLTPDDCPEDVETGWIQRLLGRGQPQNKQKGVHK
jgi:hypothetical protein